MEGERTATKVYCIPEQRVNEIARATAPGTDSPAEKGGCRTSACFPGYLRKTLAPLALIPSFKTRAFLLTWNHFGTN
jgi:hypothetical protein